jgi:protein-tyrosine sulfotransferase
MASLREALRRAYHELVHRRSRVRVVAARPVDLDEPPIFLVGTYGSGTTLLRYVVDSHPRLCCPPESGFLVQLAALAADERARAGLAGMGFDDDHVVAKLRELAVYFFGNYAASVDKPRWADKTPAYVDHLDFLLRLFPEALFVLVVRHGLDQAHSFTRGGTFSRPELAADCSAGEDPRLASVRYWRRQVEKMLDFESRRPDRCFRLRYEDLCADPEATLRPLFELLGEDWDPRVLEFHRQPHDRGFEHGRVIATRGFSASSGHFHDWGGDLAERCLDVARPLLDRLGY